MARPSGYDWPAMTHKVTLRPVTSENLTELMDLSKTLSDSQSRCLASNECSVAEAHVTETAWMRAVYLGDKPIGFVLVDLDDSDVPATDRPAVYLWRFMIGRPWQGQGNGKQVLDQLVAYFADRGIRTLYTACVLEEPEGPYDFYMKYGFSDTGERDCDEAILRLVLPGQGTEAPGSAPGSDPHS